MQATQPNSGTEQATTDGNIKRYKVSETFGEFEVRLEVDHSILTPARAKEINEFWGSPEDRIAAEKGDEVKAVIRLAGSRAAAMIISDGFLPVYSPKQGQNIGHLKLTLAMGSPIQVNRLIAKEQEEEKRELKTQLEDLCFWIISAIRYDTTATISKI